MQRSLSIAPASELNIGKWIKRLGFSGYLGDSANIKCYNRLSEIERFEDAEPETFVIGCVEVD